MRWEHVADIESDSEIWKTYEIKRSDGRYGCECPSYRFVRGEKTCKHIRAYLTGNEEDHRRALTPTVVHERVRISSGGEMFTVTRRAITFGEVR